MNPAVCSVLFPLNASRLPLFNCVTTRVDLHLHSRFSRRTEGWLFRRLGMASSYSEPRALYDALRERGFTHFTLTDQHSIEGCLALAGLPGVFISEQLTAFFPEDRAPVEVLVWGITEPQHDELLALRANIYELNGYLIQNRVAHAVAHPFFAQDPRLQTVHAEKLLLLFQHFESRCGLRAELTNEFTAAFLQSLDEEKMEALASRHAISPAHPRSWEKVLVGGSGDHSGVFAGRAWTSTPAVAQTEDLLGHIRSGRCQPQGKHGGPLTAAHGLYKKLFHVVEERFEPVRRSALAQQALSRFMEGQDPTSLTWRQKLELAVEGIVSGKVFELLKPANASLWKVLSAETEGEGLSMALQERIAGLSEPEDRAFQIANLLTGRLGFQFSKSFIQQVSEGNLIQAIQDLAVLIPVAAPLAPYFFELQREAPSRQWLRELSRSVHGKNVAPLAKQKIAWLTDTLEDVNGVSTTICKLSSAGRAEGFDVTVLSCRSNSSIQGVPLKNFAPIGEFELPEYELQKLAFPPVLEMIEYLYREGFTEIILSTPGPLGLVGLCAARLLGLPVRGIYHTDFPRYIRILTEDIDLESLTWKYMCWFYTGLDELYVNSAPYREAWIARGASASKLRILPRGLDVELFNPEKRDVRYWTKRGAPSGAPVFLYVGRVSREKDLDMLVPLAALLEKEGAVLAVVGDGPYRVELEEQIPKAVFTGYLHGQELAAAYASSDVFVFPSTTDTYGNVVVEALSSGLPCVVSDAGGPMGLVAHGKTGFVTRARDLESFTSYAVRLAADAALRSEMTQAVVAEIKMRDWSEAARSFFGAPDGTGRV